MINKNRKIVWLAGLLVCLTACVADKEEPEWYLRAGDELPLFEVTTIDGATVSSADSYKTEMIIVFFNTTCADCRRELPLLQKQYENDQKLTEEARPQYICISREEGRADVERYWKEEGLTMPVAAQDDRILYSKFASIGIPRIFYAKDGVVIRSEIN